MFFYWGKDTEIALYTLVVVITDVVLNHIDQLLFAGKSFSIVAFPFENTPKSLHRTVIDAMCHT